MSFEETRQFLLLIREDYYDTRSSLLFQIEQARKPFEQECARFIRSVSSMDEAHAAFKLTPRFSEVRYAAYLKMIEFASTVDELRDLGDRGFTGRWCIFIGTEDENPALAKWAALSTIEVETASTTNELLRARERCPYVPEDFIGRNPYREATDRLEQPFNDCQSQAALQELRLQYEKSSGSGYEVWWWRAYEHTYERLYGERYKRKYFSF